MAEHEHWWCCIAGGAFEEASYGREPHQGREHAGPTASAPGMGTGMLQQTHSPKILCMPQYRTLAITCLHRLSVPPDVEQAWNSQYSNRAVSFTGFSAFGYPQEAHWLPGMTRDLCVCADFGRWVSAQRSAARPISRPVSAAVPGSGAAPSTSFGPSSSCLGAPCSQQPCSAAHGWVPSPQLHCMPSVGCLGIACLRRAIWGLFRG